MNLAGRPYVYRDMSWKCDRPPQDPRAAVERDAFHDWILSLPWVVERPYVLGIRGVRAFAVDCPPLDIRRMWLVTGLPSGRGVALIVESSQADAYVNAGVAAPLAPMPARHTMITLSDDLGDSGLERVILDVYSTLLS